MGSRVLAILLILVALLACGHAAWLNRAYIPDDTFILLRYAQNVIDGHGPVWNPGGERVEGYTSLAALLLISGLGAVGMDLVTAARGVNLLALLALVGYLCWFFRWRARQAADDNREPDPLLLALPIALVLGSFPLAIWVMGALEGPLFCLVVTVAVGNCLVLIRERTTRWVWRAGLALGCTILVRPDGGIFGVIAGLWVLWSLRPFTVPARRLALIFTGTVLLLPVMQLLWRLAYYSAWLPNTVYAKATGLPAEVSRHGLEYLWEFLREPPYLPWLALIGLAITLWRRRPNNETLLPLACLLGYAGMVVYAGGDCMDAHRLLLPLLPLSVLVLFDSLQWALRGRGRVVTLGALLLPVGLLAMQLDHFTPLRDDQTTFVGRIVGEHIRNRWSASTTIALNTAGTTPYYAPQYRYIDMLGLNDRHIARRKVESIQLKWQRIPGHCKGDGDYVLERDPDIIILGPAAGVQKHRPWFLSDLELVENPEFLRRYEPRLEGIDVTGYAGIERFDVTREGVLVFTYYERIR
ncbi:MAG: hypothetical protein ABIF77_04490 [bacterium]